MAHVTDAPDELDGCDIDFTLCADEEETANLRALFPDGKAHDDWTGVFPDAA